MTKANNKSKQAIQVKGRGYVSQKRDKFEENRKKSCL